MKINLYMDGEGSSLKNILNFENDFDGAKIIRLEQNYRSSGNILNADQV